MVNAFLVVAVVILSLAIIAGSIYILVYFQHPEDKLVAWGPKVVVVSCTPPEYACIIVMHHVICHNERVTANLI